MKPRSWLKQAISILMIMVVVLPLGANVYAVPIGDEENNAPTADDTTAPAPITALSAVSDAPGTIELSWVAPGDDVTTGTAATYIIRYNTEPITEGNWAASTDISGEPSPSPAGTVESMTLSGLAPSQTYHFAIKTQDEVPNTSDISNSPQATVIVSSTVYLPLALSSASGTPNVPTIIPETTEVLTETTTQYMAVSADTTVFTFTQSTSGLEDVETSDVIVSNATTEAPNGFLRKVTAVSESNGQVIVETGQATLEDAIESGEAHLSQTLTPGQIQGSMQLQGVSLISPQLQDDFYFKLEDVVLYDDDGDPDTTNDQITAEGSIRLGPDFDFDLVVRNWNLEELSFTMSAVETAELEIKSELELLSIERETEIARYTFTPITVMVGPVPVVFIPVLTINVGIDGDVHVGIKTTVVQEATSIAGLRYAGETWSPVSSFSNKFRHTPPTLSAGLDLKGYTGAQLSLMLYGVTGPYAELDAYLKLEADTAEDPWWTLYGGLEAFGGVKMEVLGRSLADHEYPSIIGYRLPLAQAHTNTPPNMPFSPFPADDAVDQSVNVDLSWSGGDLDGDNVTDDVYFEADDSTPDVLVSDDQPDTTYAPDTLSANTQYYWRIVAQDEHGATTSGPVWAFATATGDTCPITLTLQSPQVTDLTATISGTVTSNCSTITRLNWQWGDGVSDDQWFPASHTYAVSGTYPITVTAYNDLGDTETAYTTAYVGTASGEMVTIPAGEFQMGCDETNPNENCDSDEQPLHTVYLDEYAIDTYEVTNAQYVEFLNAEGNQEEGGDTWLDADDSDVRIHESGGVWQADSGYEDHPVIEVTWYGARAYCQWQGKRLPTEAEWEKAARGSSDTRMYPWGDEDPDCSRLNYYAGTDYCVGDTTPVGSYPTGVSPYGAMDMAGNVWEWVNDWYDYDYYDTSPYSNPQGPDSGDYRVLRGGGWYYAWGHVRVADRSDHYYYPYYSFSTLGFRCVGVAPGP